MMDSSAVGNSLEVQIHLLHNVITSPLQDEKKKGVSISNIARKDDKARKIIVQAEKIFRGKLYKEPVEIYSVSYKPDYRLIPKDEEQLWWDRLANCKPREKIVPGSIELPPLMKLVLERDNKDSNIKLELKIRGGRDNVAQSDITKVASYSPSFFKNQQSS
ncbi:hypothetical protein ACI65C_008558 [Semiaphis heraclei]